MNVNELIKKLEKIKDKTLSINVIISDDILSNNWVIDVQEHKKGSSGYELEGEVVLITSE